MRHGAMQKTTSTWPQIQFLDLQWQEFLMLYSNPQASLQPPPKAPEDWEKPRVHDDLWAKTLEEIPSTQPVCFLTCENSCVYFCSSMLVLLMIRYSALQICSYPLNLFTFVLLKPLTSMCCIWDFTVCDRLTQISRSHFKILLWHFWRVWHAFVLLI